jgi:uncharacterized protein (UPF0147 family)
MDQEETLSAINDSIAEMREEDGLSRQVLLQLDEIVTVLSEPIDLELRIDRARSLVDALDENPSLPPYIRTQLWSITSMLESLNR